MATITQALDAAVQHHQAGNLEEAERLYKEILYRQPRHADALHLLGLVHYARGQFPQAQQHIQQAIQIDDAQPTFHNHLAEVLRAAGQLDLAAASCRQALTLDPRAAIVHNTLGTILEAQGDTAAALAEFQQALTLQPDFAQAHYNLARNAEARGDTAQALASFQQALAHKPDYPLALVALGLMLQQQGQQQQAADAYRRALALRPGDAQTHCNLGSALKDLGQAAEAVDSYRRALELDPQLAQAHFNLAVTLQAQGQWAPAERHYLKAIECNPDYPEALTNLGTVFKLQGRFDEALGCYDRALETHPDLAEAHRNRALLRLLLGKFAEGWAEYEWRRRVPGIERTTFPQPRWEGAAVPGKTVFIVGEQGLGDAIQFVRYAALVKERSQGRVLLHCQPRLRRLLETAAGVDAFLANSGGEPFDYWVPLLSLPHVFGTTLETVPAAAPYLSAQPDRVRRWRHELASQPGFKVGIAWQGNPAYQADAERSVPLAHFAALAACPKVRCYSLQAQHGREQLAQAAAWGVVDLADRFDEQEAAFVDTAAAMQCLDLVITSDTSLAHLAGALGVPVWVALPVVPDWRWLLERNDSPWYPTMRLFRQSRGGDWAEVFTRLAAELAALSSAHRLS
ncbi:MAG: tetratricopeptide repeat protein [Pirellulales bacterium]